MFAPYGRKELAISTVLFGAAFVASLLWFIWISPLFLLLLGFVGWFFRDPRRQVPPGRNTLVAPADGQVVLIDEVTDGEYVKEPCVRIAIFLSVFNVHVNRSPCAGQVEYVQRFPGGFAPAWRKETTEQNERNSLGILGDGAVGRILVKQITGLIARRIVCVVKVGDRVDKGQRFGMIKFGSRTELYVAKRTGFMPRVAVGDMVKGGLTIIGEVPEGGGNTGGAAQ
jgi:phosphatidylserine decarboxylase